MHDILTGSQPDGTAFAAGDDRTCGNWTKSGQGAAMVGHHDRQGLRDDDASKSWNSSHPHARARRWLQPERSQEHRRATASSTASPRNSLTAARRCREDH
jgi:hypothetical protein